MSESRKGISACQMQRTLGVAHRTSWYLCHRIREAMGNDPLEGPTLVGIAEVDETLTGGKKKGKGDGDKGSKTWVAGTIERGGEVRIERIRDIKKKTLHDFITRNVKNEAEAICTDELRSCIGIEDRNTCHETVNHSEEQWAVGDVHTNSVEGVWSVFKRSLIGAFHKMSARHMDHCLDEFERRFNNRDNPDIFIDALKRIVNTGNSTCKKLVA